MLPPTFSSNLNVGEKMVFEALASAQGCDDWTVIHSLKQKKVQRKYQAETDFVVMIPNLGLVLIEVKGATSYSIEGETWTFTGVPEDSVNKSPIEQIENAKGNIRVHLRLNDFDVDALPVARLVWLPKIPKDADSQKSNLGMAIMPWEIAYKEDLDSAASTVRNALLGEIESYAKNPDVNFSPERFGQSEMERIERVLIARREGLSTVDAATSILNKELGKATGQQIEILEAVQGNSNIFVHGLAGTGKTMIVGKAAVDLAVANRKVLIACSSEMMADYFKMNYGSHDNIDVYVIADRFLKDSPYATHRKGDEWYNETLPKLISKRFGRGDVSGVDRYDVICIDEFQDIASKPAVLDAIFRYFDDREGFEPQVILAADDWQQIMNGTEVANSAEVAKTYFPEITFVNLSYNCRQSPGLSEAIYAFLGRESGAPKQRVASDITWEFEIVNVQPENEVAALVEVLKGLEEDFRPENIRVLSPLYGGRSLINRVFDEQKPDDDSVWLRAHLRNSTSDGRIPWRSIPKFKGLEHDVIVITDINENSLANLERAGRNLDDMLYVGMTRARQHLVLLIGDGLYQGGTTRVKKLKKR